MLATSDNAKVLPIGQIRFDNLNPKGGAFCGVDRLTESFDQALGEGWVEYKDNDCVGTAAGGAFEATVPAGGSGQCSITTRHGYDLLGRGITLALGELPASAPGTGVSLSLTSGDSDRLTLEHRQGKLTATSLLGSGPGRCSAPGANEARVQTTNTLMVSLMRASALRSPDGQLSNSTTNMAQAIGNVNRPHVRAPPPPNRLACSHTLHHCLD